MDYEFTIFTATHNRAHTLHKLFDSLSRQSCRDFEWLVVDDGSTDDTASLIANFKEEAFFPIQYFHQSHQGKMRAHNLGLNYCKGDLFINVDSDDYLFDNALNLLSVEWRNLSTSEAYAGISCLSADPLGNIIGKGFGGGVFDSSYDEMFSNGRLSGDLLELWRTDILRKFPYNVDSDEMFVPDGLIFHQISRTFPVRFINKPMQVVVYQSDGISKNSISYRAKNPKGMCNYYQNMLKHLPSGLVRIRCEINLFRYHFHQDSTYSSGMNGLGVFVREMAFSSLGRLLYWRDVVCIRLGLVCSGEKSNCV